MIQGSASIGGEQIRIAQSTRRAFTNHYCAVLCCGTESTDNLRMHRLTDRFGVES